MIEVLFGESEAGSMKAAKNRKVSADWIQGSSEEVICLGFLMDIGDIREPMESSYRRNLICSMYAQDQWGKDEEIREELKRLGDVYAREIHRLERFLDLGEPVRIWYSDAPYSICGFYSLCQILKGHESAVSVVRLPGYVVRDKSIVARHSWGEVSAEEFAAFLSYERPLSKQEIHMYAMQWSILTEENSSLRVVINGRVVSAPEDFYDFLIWKWMKDVPVKEARLIGDILGHEQLGVGDWWYARRIEYYIRQGKIRVMEDSEKKYARVICAGQGLIVCRT